MCRFSMFGMLAASIMMGQGLMPAVLTGEIQNAPDDYVVELLSGNSHQVKLRTYGRADGRFSLGPTEPGNYELRVSTDRGEMLYSEQIQLQPGQPMTQIRLREQAAPARPVSGVVSARELTQERRKALRLVMDATGLRQRSKIDAAIRKYEQAIRTDPTYAVPHHDLAVQYINMKRPWDARRHLLRAIELDPNLRTAYVNLSVADLALGDPLGAELSAQHALSLNRDDPKASYLKSVSLYMQRRGPKPAPYESFARR